MPFNPAWLPKPLVLHYGDTTYTVPAPTKDVGIMLAAIVAVGFGPIADALAGRGLDAENSGVSSEQRDLVQQLTRDGVEIASLSLGSVYTDMLAARVPGPDIDRMALYAMYYWVMGEQAADTLMATAFGEGDDLGEARSATGRSSTPKAGRRTASANRTRTASTRPTAAPHHN